SGRGFARARQPLAAGRAARQLASERRLSRADRVQGVLRRRAPPRVVSHGRRSALDDCAAGVDRAGHADSRYLSESCARAGGKSGAVMRRWFSAGLALFAVGEIAATFVFHADHAHFWFEDIPAWGSVYGLVSCLLIVIVSKLLGKLWLTRPENYYDS